MMKNNIEVAIIGMGNVATHLYKALSAANISISNVDKDSTKGKRIKQ